MTQETKTLKTPEEILKEKFGDFDYETFCSILTPQSRETIIQAMLAYHEQYNFSDEDIERFAKMAGNAKGYIGRKEGMEFVRELIFPFKFSESLKDSPLFKPAQ